MSNPRANRWRLANLDRRSAYMREWRRRNPDLASANEIASKANGRARHHCVTGRLRGADVLALWSRQPVCVACDKGRGIDHIVAFADGGLNEPANLQTMCQPCNTTKEGAAKRARHEPTPTGTVVAIAETTNVSSG